VTVQQNPATAEMRAIRKAGNQEELRIFAIVQVFIPDPQPRGMRRQRSIDAVIV
jgi:hypothetical protein